MRRSISNSAQFAFTLQARSGSARAGLITTSHGLIETPMYMPVGTKASVKSLDNQDLIKLGAQIILANNYHLFLRPGLTVIEEWGGVHKMMGWHRPILTDSGGYQVFSLANQQGGPGVKITESGVEFQSPLDGDWQMFTPRSAIAAQQIIGADIIMAFDQCANDNASKQEHQAMIDRTQFWAEQSVDQWLKANKLSKQGNYQALFGIVQGGRHLDLRQQAARGLMQLPFDGFAAGGETVGYHMKESVKVMQHLNHVFPEDKPRYAMGLGAKPQDLIDAVMSGFDIFDCVSPTRIARNGALFVGKLVIESGKPRYDSPFTQGRLQIGNSQYRLDEKPIDSECHCHTCSHGYTRAYLHYLFKQKELSYFRLATIHNLYVMINTVKQLRAQILAGNIR